jgi:protein MBA1
MYTALGTGNLGPIQSQLCESIASTMEERINARGPNTTITWTLHEWLAAPKIVSHKFLPMDLTENKDKEKQTTIQQVVVRMESLQSLVRSKRAKVNGKVVEQPIDQGEPKPVKEFLVVQRLMKAGKQGDWMIWGTTTESHVDDTLE